MRPLDSDSFATTRYEVLRAGGAGGMGVVYEARDRERGVRVALKTLRDFGGPSLSGDAVLRFKNEFRALQGIEHPNLVNLGELVEEDGRWFFTMELVDGVSFIDFVRPAAEDEPPISPTADTLDPARDDRSAPSLSLPPTPTRRLDEARLRAAYASQICRLRHAASSSSSRPWAGGVPGAGPAGSRPAGRTCHPMGPNHSTAAETGPAEGSPVARPASGMPPDGGGIVAAGPGARIEVHCRAPDSRPPDMGVVTG